VVHEFINGSYRETNLTNESADYFARREELRLAEIELMEHQERVAALRRALPPGAVLGEYEFLEGPIHLNAGDEPVRTVRLNELFTVAERPLVIYHMMYGKKQTKPCPMCTMWWTDSTEWPTTSRRTSIFVVVMAAEFKAMRGRAGGTICVCSAQARIPSSSISAVKTLNGRRTLPSLFW
jgi:predicted dithiol-disulfide oxidoreductase (DUF899 family)